MRLDVSAALKARPGVLAVLAGADVAADGRGPAMTSKPVAWKSELCAFGNWTSGAQESQLREEEGR